jgi:hypothetical protein
MPKVPKIQKIKNGARFKAWTVFFLTLRRVPWTIFSMSQG